MIEEGEFYTECTAYDVSGPDSFFESCQHSFIYPVQAHNFPDLQRFVEEHYHRAAYEGSLRQPSPGLGCCVTVARFESPCRQCSNVGTRGKGRGWH